MAFIILNAIFFIKELKNYCNIYFYFGQNNIEIKTKEGINMEKCNECIRCTVENCRHHHNAKNYCTLDAIQVGTHEGNPTMDQCTDCKSFTMR